MEVNENPKSKFEEEMMKRMDRVIVNIEDFKGRFDNLEKDVSEIKADIREVKADVKILKGQFNDVAVMAIEDNKRITKLEKDVEDLQGGIH